MTRCQPSIIRIRNNRPPILVVFDPLNRAYCITRFSAHAALNKVASGFIVNSKMVRRGFAGHREIARPR
jgi:hypothetical protein